LKEGFMARHRIGTEELSIAQLEAMLESRRAKLGKLERLREGLQKRLAALDAEIAAHGGSVSAAGIGRRRRGRAHNARSLPDTIADVLNHHGKLKVSELVKAILATGYKTNSANFRSIVNQALIKDRKRFGAVERGVYALKIQ
jgi:hypothetical protein